MIIQESAEMYLETILILSRREGKVRAVDISRHLNYSKPSVSRAVGLLREEGLISVDKEGAITLMPEGLCIAEQIYERHQVLSNFLIRLGVSEETALEDACRIEHVISSESFDALKQHSEQL